MRHRPFPTVRIAVMFALLFLLAIPWWWRWVPTIGNRTLWGAPIWFVTAVGGSLLVSIVTVKCLAIAWNALDEEDVET